MMSEGPSRWQLRAFTLLVNHGLEDSLDQFLILHIEVDLETDLFL